MDLNALKALDSSDLATLILLVRQYRDDVKSGAMSGFRQPAIDEVADAEALIAKLQAAR
jgi:hypothetical protein